MGKTVNARHAALAKARERRLELDAERDARDRRIEEAAAEVFVLVARRVDAEQQLDELNTAIGTALRKVLAEGISVDAASRLVDLDAVDVRRLAKRSRLDRPQSSDAAAPRSCEPWDIDQMNGQVRSRIQ